VLTPDPSEGRKTIQGSKNYTFAKLLAGVERLLAGVKKLLAGAKKNFFRK